MHPKRWIILVVILIGILIFGVALAAPNNTLVRWVLGAGGGTTSAGETTLYGTVGQWAVGCQANANLELSSGFWWTQGLSCQTSQHIYLPLVTK